MNVGAKMEWVVGMGGKNYRGLNRLKNTCGLRRIWVIKYAFWIMLMGYDSKNVKICC